MLESKISQFTLSNEGQILWQEKLNNPLPGIAVAQLEKGKQALKPVINVLENNTTAKYDALELKNNLSLWMNTHLSEILDPLMLLEVTVGAVVNDDPVSLISARIYDGLGIVRRSDIEDIIAKLTSEARGDLRAKKIRLGPILAFIPALNKPAAVKLRAILWSLFKGNKLPASVPADGVVSVKIAEENPSQEYYRSIGYPLYGGRAIRIDMLDRVISCVYDAADKGKFQARHEMAEWLGCSIVDLYEVLISMGHVKIYDPADKVISDADKPTETSVEEKTEEKKENIKPELATFRLKKGKAFQNTTNDGNSNDGNSKKQDFKKKKAFSQKTQKSNKSKKKERDNSPKIVSIEAKKNDEDNPFAILQQLKNK